MEWVGNVHVSILPIDTGKSLLQLASMRELTTYCFAFLQADWDPKASLAPHVSSTADAVDYEDALA